MRRPDIPVVPLREAAETLGLTTRAAESALRTAGIRSGYPLDLVNWLKTNRPGRGKRTDIVKTYRIDLVTADGRIVDDREFDDYDEALAFDQQHRHSNPGSVAWTISGKNSAEIPGLHR